MRGILAVLATLILATATFAQQPVKTAAKTTDQALALTKGEASQYEVIELKQQNLQLRHQVIQTQIEKVSQQLQVEGQRIDQEKKDLTERLAKAHNLDPAKYTLNKEGFVPIAQAPAKPAK